MSFAKNEKYCQNVTQCLQFCITTVMSSCINQKSFKTLLKEEPISAIRGIEMLPAQSYFTVILAPEFKRCIFYQPKLYR